MKNKNLLWISIVVMVGMLFTSGCDEIDINKLNLSDLSEEDINKLIVCKEPYMRYGTECCLDQDNNKICDNDEGLNSDLNVAPVCNSPYIQVGGGCCLDQDNNKICDNDEKDETDNNTPNDDTTEKIVINTPKTSYTVTQGNTLTISFTVKNNEKTSKSYALEVLATGWGESVTQQATLSAGQEATTYAYFDVKSDAPVGDYVAIINVKEGSSIVASKGISVKIESGIGGNKPECLLNTDCPPKEPLDEPFCVGVGKYQRYKYYRCGIGTNVCESYERDERIGSCLCETNADCGEKEPIDEPFCLGDYQFQKFKYYRCGIGTNVCESYERDLNIGEC